MAASGREQSHAAQKIDAAGLAVNRARYRLGGHRAAQSVSSTTDDPRPVVSNSTRTGSREMDSR